MYICLQQYTLYAVKQMYTNKNKKVILVNYNVLTGRKDVTMVYKQKYVI